MVRQRPAGQATDKKNKKWQWVTQWVKRMWTTGSREDVNGRRQRGCRRQEAERALTRGREGVDDRRQRERRQQEAERASTTGGRQRVDNRRQTARRQQEADSASRKKTGEGEPPRKEADGGPRRESLVCRGRRVWCGRGPDSPHCNLDLKLSSHSLVVAHLGLISQ